jgi:hypothetical protein
LGLEDEGQLLDRLLASQRVAVEEDVANDAPRLAANDEIPGQPV